MAFVGSWSSPSSPRVQTYANTLLPAAGRSPSSPCTTRSSSFSDGSTESSLSSDESTSEEKEKRSLYVPSSDQRSHTTTPPLNATVALVIVYFALNLALTFYNKSLLNNFPFPYFLTSVHAASGVIGCFCLRLVGVPFRTRDAAGEEEVESKAQAALPFFYRRASSSSLLDQHNVALATHTKRLAVVMGYSALYAANIAMSNASLRLVSMPFHQIVRSTCPLFTLVLGYVMLSKRPAARALMALGPIVAGAALSCYGGTLRATSMGVLLTVFGTFLAALKTVSTNVLQGGNNSSTTIATKTGKASSLPEQVRQTIRRYAFHYSALELLEVMSPLAFVQCLLVSHLSGELRMALTRLSIGGGDHGNTVDRSLVGLLLVNGAIAFLLNIVSFKTNKAAGPLTMTVVGNVKQVVTIVLAVYVYSLTITLTNGLGIVLALVGTAWYSIESLRARGT